MTKLVQHVTLEKPIRYTVDDDHHVADACGGPPSLRIVALSGWEEPCENEAFRRFRVTAIYPHHDDGRALLDAEWRGGEARSVATYGEDSDGDDYPSEFHTWRGPARPCLRRRVSSSRRSRSSFRQALHRGAHDGAVYGILDGGVDLPSHLG